MAIERLAPEKRPFVRGAYNYDVDAVSVETGFESTEESLTQQHMYEETEINNIVNRILKTGEIPQSVRLPQYGDFTGIDDYQSALNALKQTEQSFMSLPGAVRARFHNDPAEFFEFCCDDRNYEEAKKLGLLKELPDSPAAPMPAKQATDKPAGA